jgi:hypothetical protein
MIAFGTGGERERLLAELGQAAAENGLADLLDALGDRSSVHSRREVAREGTLEDPPLGRGCSVGLEALDRGPVEQREDADVPACGHIVGVEPELVERVRRGPSRIEPDRCAFGGLPERLPVQARKSSYQGVYGLLPSAR